MCQIWVWVGGVRGAKNKPSGYRTFLFNVKERHYKTKPGKDRVTGTLTADYVPNGTLVRDKSL